MPFNPYQRTQLPQFRRDHREDRRRRLDGRLDGSLSILLRREGSPRADEPLRQMQQQSLQRLLEGVVRESQAGHVGVDDVFDLRLLQEDSRQKRHRAL